ncbi:MAG: DUF899 family protein [Bacteroidetes bacterium]|nr:DUF899 family protein [Bacteroidota bacterium]
MTEEEKKSIHKELRELYTEIHEKRKKAIELTAKLGDTIVSQDYEFTSTDGGKVKLSEMFGGHKNLFVVHNMGGACSFCTMWADGFNGMYKYLESRGKSGFVLMAGDEIEAHKKFKNSRGWTFQSCSAIENDFSKEMGFQNNAGGIEPGLSVLEKTDDGKIRRINQDFFGPTDMYCSVWRFLELLPDENIKKDF